MPRSIHRTFTSTILAGQLGAVAYVLVDTIIVAHRANIGLISTVRGLVVVIGLALPAGSLAGALVAPIYGREPPPRVSTLVSLAIGCSVWITAWARSIRWVARTFHNTSLAALLVATIGIALAALCVVGFAAARRHLGRLDEIPWLDGWRLTAVASGIAALVMAFIQRVPSQLWMAVFIAHLAAWRFPISAPRWTPIATAIAALLLAIGPPGNDRDARLAHYRFGTLRAPFEKAITPLLDVDNDGFLAVLGGDDCAEFDASRSPHGIEVAGNGVDEDCRFGDLRQHWTPTNATRAGRAFTPVVLVTVSGLDMSDDGSLVPALPQLQRLVNAGIRFPLSVGLGGSEKHAIALLLRGELPVASHPRDTALPTGGVTLPYLVEHSGGRAVAAATKSVHFNELATQFLRSRSSWDAKDPEAVIASVLKQLKGGRREFAWVHLTLEREGSNQSVQDALQHLVRYLDARAARQPYRLLIVGLAPRDKSPTQAPPRGGLLAILGSDVTPGMNKRPVSMFDVFPTIAGLLGVFSLPPRIGQSVLDDTRSGPALGGWLLAEPVMGAFDTRGSVVHRPGSRRFELHSAGKNTFANEDASAFPDWAQLHIELLRDEFLAPMLLRRNLLIHEAINAPWPDPLPGPKLRIADALTIHGCAHELLPGGQMAITLFMEGGEHLRPTDLLTLKFSSPGGGSMRARVLPVEGAMPFGPSWAGRRVADRILVDLRPMRAGLATFWVGVHRNGKRLRISEGVGNTKTWGRACAIEVGK